MSTEAAFPQRVAGLLLIVNGALLFAERAFLSGGSDGSLARSAAPLILDAVLGLPLACGFRRIVGLVLLRTLVGVVLGPMILIPHGEIALTFVHLFYMFTLLLLLIPGAERVRTATGMVLGAAFLGLQGIGVVWAVVTGEPASESAAMAGRAEPTSDLASEPPLEPLSDEMFVTCDLGGAVTVIRKRDCLQRGGHSKR